MTPKDFAILIDQKVQMKQMMMSREKDVGIELNSQELIQLKANVWPS